MKGSYYFFLPFFREKDRKIDYDRNLPFLLNKVSILGKNVS